LAKALSGSLKALFFPFIIIKNKIKKPKMTGNEKRSLVLNSSEKYINKIIVVAK